MEEELLGPHKGIALGDHTAAFMDFSDRNRKRYDEELEPELVKLTISLRTEYGIMPVGLTDGAILNNAILPQTVMVIRKGLSEAGNRLWDLLANKAAGL